jgi:Ca2+-binding RTX toxin-like protein
MSRAAAAVLFALFAIAAAIGLVFVTSLEATRPLCGGRKATIASNDRTIKGTRGHDVIVAGRGPNEVFGGGGNDVICGGYGRDVIKGGRGKDTLDGKKDADRVSGGRGSDEVDGGSGNDVVRGDSGNDRVRGGPGRSDLVDGGMGDDFMDGGRGDLDAAPSGIGRNRLVRIESVLEFEVGSDGPRVELRKGLPGSSNLVISGGDGAEAVGVDFRERRYLVLGLGAPVRIGGPGVGSIHVALGAGDDRASFSRSLPPGVSVVVDGGPGRDSLRGGPGRDTLYGGDDADPDRLAGGGGDDALFGVNTDHPRRPSGAAIMLGGGGDDLLIGGQPCEGDLFAGGPGRFDSASFARVRNPGTVVRAQIGGRVLDPGIGGCAGGRITGSTEKIEGSTGRDILLGSPGADVLLGRGGPDRLDGRGGEDRCIGGRAEDGAQRCEYVR